MDEKLQELRQTMIGYAEGAVSKFTENLEQALQLMCLELDVSETCDEALWGLNELFAARDRETLTTLFTERIDAFLREYCNHDGVIHPLKELAKSELAKDEHRAPVSFPCSLIFLSFDKHRAEHPPAAPPFCFAGHPPDVPSAPTHLARQMELNIPKPDRSYQQ